MLFLRADASLRGFEQVFHSADVAFQLMRQCMHHACQTIRSRSVWEPRICGVMQRSAPLSPDQARCRRDLTPCWHGRCIRRH